MGAIYDRVYDQYSGMFIIYRFSCLVQCVALAAQAIKLGQAEVIIAGGMEVKYVTLH